MPLAEAMWKGHFSQGLEERGTALWLPQLGWAFSSTLTSSCGTVQWRHPCWVWWIAYWNPRGPLATTAAVWRAVLCLSVAVVNLEDGSHSHSQLCFWSMPSIRFQLAFVCLFVFMYIFTVHYIVTKEIHKKNSSLSLIIYQLWYTYISTLCISIDTWVYTWMCINIFFLSCILCTHDLYKPWWNQL